VDFIVIFPDKPLYCVAHKIRISYYGNSRTAIGLLFKVIVAPASVTIFLTIKRCASIVSMDGILSTIFGVEQLIGGNKNKF
jgi:hypothetical protein